LTSFVERRRAYIAYIDIPYKSLSKGLIALDQSGQTMASWTNTVLPPVLCNFIEIDAYQSVYMLSLAAYNSRVK
jgi:hypothetical protein